MGACYQNEQKKLPKTTKIKFEEDKEEIIKKESWKKDIKKIDTLPTENMKDNEKDKRINECIVQNKSEPFEKLDRKVMNVSKSICKLKIETNSKTIIGTGFLLNFGIDQERFCCLMSNDHIIEQEMINNKNNINISYDNEFKIINIKLDTSKRYIKSFIEEGLDITVVEILEEDNIYRDYFLWNEDETDNNRIINNEIYIPQYAKGEELVNARGKIIKINKYEFTHLANTEHGSSGSPIFLENSTSVIGIHKQSNEKKTKNYGDFIYPVINMIKEDIRKKRNNGKYIIFFYYFYYSYI